MLSLAALDITFNKDGSDHKIIYYINYISSKKQLIQASMVNPAITRITSSDASPEQPTDNHMAHHVTSDSLTRHKTLHYAT